jgi:thioredoxin-related protein
MKSVFLLLFLTLGLVSKGQENGIRFGSDSLLSSVLRKAMTANMLVFVACYTAWCGPCREMDRQEYSDAEVGKFFNKNFICVKFNMEKPEGLKIGKEYNIKAFPTLLFLNSKGEQIYYYLGSLDSKTFIKIGQNVLNKNLKDMTNSVKAGIK